jgi:biotin transport system substrate-specific component
MTTQSQALIPNLFVNIKSRKAAYLLSLLAGSLLLSLLARLSFSLPFTPVPITGQTFGVSLLALLWGRQRAILVFGIYILEGLCGLPVFAGGSGLGVGPTAGYLLGMAIATVVVGTLADRGFAKSFRSSLLCCFVGSLCVFSCGLFLLSFFIPARELLIAGLLPFLPGDLVKNISAAAIASRLSKAAGRV